MVVDRRWELLAVLLLTLTPGGSARLRYLPSTPPTVIHPIVHTSVRPIPKPEPEICLDSGEVVLRLSRIGIRVVPDGLVDSSRVTELQLDDNGITEVSCGAFEMVPNLQTLNISSNNISTDRLLYFGEHKGLRRLIVDDNNRNDPKHLELKTIYKSLPNLWELSLRRSHVAVFAVSLTKFAPNLYRISLSGNNIESSEFLKDAPKKLKYLDLSENRISEIPVGLLPNGLLELSVAGNRIRELCAGSCEDYSLSLHNLTSLRTLIASRNEIATLQSDAFQSLMNLVVLDLSGNVIHELLGTLWDRPWQIQELRIAKNKLTSVPKLCQLRKLQRLDLSGNSIPSVTNENICEGLNQLQFFFLNDNLILEVNGIAFRKFKALRTLDLSGNLLTTVPWNLISSTSMEVLLMRRNGVTTLANLAKEQGNLRELHLQDNPLLFINTTWINSVNLPYLQILLKDHSTGLPDEIKCPKDKEPATNSDEDDDDG